MRVKREYKVGTPIHFKWYYNDDRFTNPNPQFVVEEGIVESNTCLNDVIIYSPKDDAYFCVLTEDII